MVTPKLLRSLRNKAGFTQAQLAAKIGVEPHVVTAIEGGNRRIDTAVLEPWLWVCGAYFHIATDQPSMIAALISQAEALSPDDLDLLMDLAKVIPSLSEEQRQTLVILMRGWFVNSKLSTSE